MISNRVFPPETIEMLAAAFEKAWRFVGEDPQFASRNKAELQARLAACLIDLAAAGEGDALRLANAAIAQLRGLHRAHRLPAQRDDISPFGHIP